VRKEGYSGGYESKSLPFACYDVMWCLSPFPPKEAHLNDLMQKRLRRSKPDREEFEQAAATQVLFHEAYAMLHALRLKAGIAPPMNPYYVPEKGDEL